MGNPAYLVGLSGPPRSGKDTLGNVLAGILRDRDVSVEVHALSLPMRLAVYGYLGLTYTEEHYDAHKDDAIPVFGGKATTIRKEMIALSEHFIKPRLGHGWWGNALLNRTTGAKVVIVTDMGFHAEHDVFVDRYGRENCAWVHLYREGTDFSNDSRDYVGRGIPVRNDYDPDSAALGIYEHLVRRCGWQV